MIGLAPLDLGRKRSFEMPRVFLYTSFCSTSSWEEDNGERKEEGREHEVKWMEGEGWVERGGGRDSGGDRGCILRVRRKETSNSNQTCSCYSC